MISRLAMRKAARLKPLSKSHLLDCVGDSVKGCEGGSLSAAYEWMNKNGALYEEEYRDYDAKQSKCTKPKGKIGIGSIKSMRQSSRVRIE